MRQRGGGSPPHGLDCEPTTSGPSDCEGGSKGSFPLSFDNGFDPRLAAHQCLHACAKCRRCRWVSVSELHLDCSWYASCSQHALEQKMPGFRTGKNVASAGSHSAFLML